MGVSQTWLRVKGFGLRDPLDVSICKYVYTYMYIHIYTCIWAMRGFMGVYIIGDLGLILKNA